MSTPHICSSCRRTLFVRLQARVRIQWHAKAAFTTRNGLRIPTDSPRREDLLDIADGKQDVPARIPSASKPRPWKPTQDAGDILESLFESAVLKDEPSAAPDGRDSSIEAYRHMEKILVMLGDRMIPRGRIWEYFVEHFEPRDGNIDELSRPSAFPTMARNLFSDILNANKDLWQGVGEFESLPKMSDVARMYSKLGLMGLNDWDVLLWETLGELTRRELSIPQDNTLVSSEKLYTELLDIWNLFCFQYRHARRQHGKHNISSPRDWSSVPEIGPNHRDIFHRYPNAALDIVSRTLFPSYPIERTSQPIACAAILTYALFSHPSKAEASSIKQGFPFLRAVHAIIGRSWVTRLEIRDKISRKLELNDTESIDALWKLLLETNHDQYPQFPEIGGSNSPNVDIQRKLNHMVRTREVARIDALYAATVEAQDGNPFREDQPKYHELHNQFIKAYMSCHEAGRAVTVWNHMIQSGLQPSILTWTAMLEGCRISRDVQALESVWQKLQLSGMEPDVVCWTTVICGFIENNKGLGREQANITKGLHLLEEMGRAWIEAEKQAGRSKLQVNQAAKPTIFTLNAVLKCLLNKKRYQLVDTLLKWGKQFHIKNDIVTYNTLLGSYIRSEQTDKVQALLKEMETAGVQVDIITFTTILEETFRNSSSFTEKQRAAVVSNVFVEMEKCGIEANVVTYGKILYILLQDASRTGDLSTVQSVLQRMHNQGIAPTEYILTNLVNFHFTRTPPQIEEVEILIERMRSAKNVNSEVIFWDRVIEGYAQIGDPLTALKYFGRYNRKGARVGWTACCLLLRSLATGGYSELAEQFIRDIRLDRRARPAPNARGEQSEHLFWEMVDEFEASS